MNETNQKEIDDSINLASAGLLLLDFITRNSDSPYCNMKTTFARRESIIPVQEIGAFTNHYCNE